MPVRYLDRDNPPRQLRPRIKRWRSPEYPNLEILDRKYCSPLTDGKWSTFLYSKYGMVIIDSYGSFTEGVEENEAGGTSKAVAAVLDNARQGPAVIILANLRRALAGNSWVFCRLLRGCPECPPYFNDQVTGRLVARSG